MTKTSKQQRISAKANKTKKSAAAFRTISEVASELGVEQHVLRFWETKFTHVKPMKRGGGRRFYRPEDVKVLKAIHTLLYQDGYTIKGAQKLLSSSKNKVLDRLVNRAEDEPILKADVVSKTKAPKSDAQEASLVKPAQKAELAAMLAELRGLREMLQTA